MPDPNPQDSTTTEGPPTLHDGLTQFLKTKAKGDDWNGYLLPSPSSKSGHISTETARRHFRDLADEAGVTVDGTAPTPKMGRRYWYTAYGAAVKRVSDRFQDIAEEQGSKSAEVVLDNYLSKPERRYHRRDEMRDDLEGLFDSWRYIANTQEIG